MPLLSVIVPVYKVEAYLPQCVESILAQTVSDLELILVDDGSPDRCGAICDEYAQSHPNIKVIHKENGGLPAARRTGLGAASGKYFTFVDSDDWIEPHMYEKMLELAEQNEADIVAAGFVRDREGELERYQNALPSGVYRGESLVSLREKAIFSPADMQSGVAPSVWSKIFRMESAGEHFLKEENTQNFGEDAIFVYPLMFRVNCIVIDNDNFAYHYRIRSESIINTFRSGYFADLQNLDKKLVAGLQGYLNDDIRKALAHYYIYQYVDGVYRLLGRGNQAAVREKCENIRKLAGEARLQECLEYVEAKQLPPKVWRTAQLMGKGRPNSFLVYHVVSAVASKVKRMVK